MGDDETHVEYAAIEVGAQHQIYGTYVVIDTDLVLATALNRYAIASGPAWGMRHTFIPRGEIVGSGGSALS
jgi:hypothetical protein